MFVCYDELNEINMFQVKYKLSPCIYIGTDGANLYRDILHTATKFCNETLYKHHHQTDSSSKALFKVFPKTIKEVPLCQYDRQIQSIFAVAQSAKDKTKPRCC